MHCYAVQKKNVCCSCRWDTPRSTVKCTQFYCVCNRHTNRIFQIFFCASKCRFKIVQFHCMCNKQTHWGLPDLFLCIAMLCWKNTCCSWRWDAHRITFKYTQFYCFCDRLTNRIFQISFCASKCRFKVVQFYCICIKQTHRGLPDLFLCIAMLCRNRIYVLVVYGLHLALLSNVCNSIACV